MVALHITITRFRCVMTSEQTQRGNIVRASWYKGAVGSFLVTIFISLQSSQILALYRHQFRDPYGLLNYIDIFCHD